MKRLNRIDWFVIAMAITGICIALYDHEQVNQFLNGQTVTIVFQR